MDQFLSNAIIRLVTATTAISTGTTTATAATWATLTAATVSTTAAATTASILLAAWLACGALCRALVGSCFGRSIGNRRLFLLHFGTTFSRYRFSSLGLFDLRSVSSCRSGFGCFVIVSHDQNSSPPSRAASANAFTRP